MNIHTYVYIYLYIYALYHLASCRQSHSVVCECNTISQPLLKPSALRCLVSLAALTHFRAHSLPLTTPHSMSISSIHSKNQLCLRSVLCIKCAVSKLLSHFRNSIYVNMYVYEYMYIYHTGMYKYNAE